MAAQPGASAASKDQAFFSEEATRQILFRIANVFNDADLCDATFVVGEGADKEEISAPSQFMAVSSSYFKNLFYPPGENMVREIPGTQPKTFRKILDYLFRGRVPLSSIEDAWKVKIAGRTFDLKELEELCTKFLKYRIDSKNLVHFLKNTTKYDTPDLREVVISRFVKDASNGFEDEQVLELSESELLSIMERKPEVQAKKVMEVLIKWARKRYNLEVKLKEESKATEVKEAEPEKKPEEPKPDDQVSTETADMESSNKPEREKETEQGGKDKESGKGSTENNSDIGNKEKEDEQTEDVSKAIDDNKMAEGTESTITNTEDFILPLQNLVKHVTWDNNDAEYYLKEIHAKKILSEDTKNFAMAQMLQAFVDLPPTIAQPSSTVAKVGPKSVQQQRATPQNRNQRGGQKRTADTPSAGRPGECDIVMERISKNPRAVNARVKSEDDLML